VIAEGIGRQAVREIGVAIRSRRKTSGDMSRDQLSAERVAMPGPLEVGGVGA